MPCGGGHAAAQLRSGAAGAFDTFRVGADAVALALARSLAQCDPFGEKFTQAWPVTPYTLRVTNHSGDKARAQSRPSPGAATRAHASPQAEAQVYIDGTLACEQFVDAGVSEIKGFKGQSTGDWNPCAPKSAALPLPRSVAGARRSALTARGGIIIRPCRAQGRAVPRVHVHAAAPRAQQRESRAGL